MRILLLTVILLTAGTARSMTLEEAVDFALDHRGDVRAAVLSAEKTTWNRRNADLWFLPRMNGRLVFTRNFDVQQFTIPGVGSVPMGSRYASLAGITVDVPLFTAVGPAASRLASRSEKLSMRMADAVRLDAVVRVVKAFYGVLLAREMVDVSREALETAEEGYGIAERKYDAGLISRFELIQSRVAWENRGPALVNARNALEDGMKAFSVAIGVDGPAAVELEGDIASAPGITLPGSLEEARAVMMERSPELWVAEYTRSVADAGVDMARAAFFPQLLFNAGLNYQASRDDMEFGIDDYERNFTVSVILQVPLFDGFSDVSGYKSASADRAAAAASAFSMEQVADMNLAAAWNKLRAARERVDATASTVEQAAEGAEIAKVSYEEGMITRLEMDQAFLALSSARANHAAALFDLRIAEAELSRAMGTMEGYFYDD